jgi:hypothetical protein
MEVVGMNEYSSKHLFQLNYSFNNAECYIFTFLFVIGNLFFPWLVHAIPLGGLKFLPIYFFVLIGAYKFGWRVGILTAIFSPIVNHMLAGMPPINMLPWVLVKGISMALIASILAHKTKKLSFMNLVIIIMGTQAIGILFESIYSSKWAVQDLAIGYSGLLIQLFFGYLVLWLLKDFGESKSSQHKVFF